jgi:hypothetical protein
VALRRLSEAEGLDLVEAAGLPVVKRAVAGPDEVVRAAERLGYPVVLKALDPEAGHKTDAGLVATGLCGSSQVEAAAAAMDRGAYLVQQHVSSIRELAFGLTRDESFGPCVMAGFGGIHAELVDDTIFAAAPVTPEHALSMLEGLRTRAMLGAYRGAAPADLDTLSRFLVVLGQLGLGRPEIAQVDLNPVLVGHDGSVVAVDALVLVSTSSGRR